jgi:hypothetical protein
MMKVAGRRFGALGITLSASWYGLAQTPHAGGGGKRRKALTMEVQAIFSLMARRLCDLRRWHRDDTGGMTIEGP